MDSAHIAGTGCTRSAEENQARLSITEGCDDVNGIPTKIPGSPFLYRRRTDREQDANLNVDVHDAPTEQEQAGQKPRAGVQDDHNASDGASVASSTEESAPAVPQDNGRAASSAQAHAIARSPASKHRLDEDSHDDKQRPLKQKRTADGGATADPLPSTTDPLSSPSLPLQFEQSFNFESGKWWPAYDRPDAPPTSMHTRASATLPLADIGRIVRLKRASYDERLLDCDRGDLYQLAHELDQFKEFQTPVEFQALPSAPGSSTFDLLVVFAKTNAMVGSLAGVLHRSNAGLVVNVFFSPQVYHMMCAFMGTPR
eukprot:m.47772 g.47772  ORF g.47772 m.47772 type:complete len:313 (+) comp6379_c0_seq4:219-1157(+)